MLPEDGRPVHEYQPLGLRLWPPNWVSGAVVNKPGPSCSLLLSPLHWQERQIRSCYLPWRWRAEAPDRPAFLPAPTLGGAPGILLMLGLWFISLDTAHPD